MSEAAAEAIPTETVASVEGEGAAVSEGRPSRKRTSVSRFEADKPKETEEASPSGNGTPLGEIPYIKTMLDKAKDEDVLKQLSLLCYNRPGKKHTRKKQLRAFNGWADPSVSSAKADKLGSNAKVPVAMLKTMCAIVGVERSGTKEELATRLIGFLADPSDDAVTDTSSAPLTSVKRKSAGKGGKAKKAKKDGKSTKKRAPSSYILFCSANRNQVKADNPDFGATDILKHLGEMWRELSEDEKADWAAQSKARQAEMDGEDGEADAAAEEEEDEEEEQEGDEDPMEEDGAAAEEDE